MTGLCECLQACCADRLTGSQCLCHVVLRVLRCQSCLRGSTHRLHLLLLLLRQVEREGRVVEVPSYSAMLLKQPDPRAPDAKTLAQCFPELRLDRPKAGGKK